MRETPFFREDFLVDGERGERVIAAKTVFLAQRTAHPEDTAFLHSQKPAPQAVDRIKIDEGELRRIERRSGCQQAEADGARARFAQCERIKSELHPVAACKILGAQRRPAAGFVINEPGVLD